ncbi:vancomycin high temperature exclusion protein [Tenacibaculum sp. IB213877]|uniref:SanA/YdcF family protein n=1 Tax=Tenacibaculum sp. IB213877 TaxID=3097351 RepID=UPI002A5A8965|nr:ElyC/SanA/YdcF family protein [Tenacibaculum sp. IB213877]MDY0780025.1 ElyC/SanA/YdcF family protein [Tenacibaculum sp. IB213877]
MKFKRAGKIVLFGAILSVFLCFLANEIIEKNAAEKVFSEMSAVPNNKVGLVLGTSKHLSDGRINLYYKYRVEAAIALFRAGKVDIIIVSGDNGSKSYDEPTDFKNDLIKGGIPEARIFLDYAGFRTLDSVVRVKEIFGQESITIISQPFHNERAIYLAEHFNIQAVAFNAKDITGKYGLKVKLREYLARVKVFVDVLFNVQPKFLGDKITIK